MIDCSDVNSYASDSLILNQREDIYENGQIEYGITFPFMKCLLITWL